MPYTIVRTKNMKDARKRFKLKGYVIYKIIYGGKKFDVGNTKRYIIYFRKRR